MKTDSNLEIEVLEEMGYNSEDKTYTPWYGLPQNVDFESERVSWKGGLFSSHGIEINKSIFSKDKIKVFYHEKIHADIFPANVLAKLFGLASILSLGMPKASDNNPYLVSGLCLLSSLAYFKAVNLLDEAIAYTAEHKKFGIPGNSTLTKKVLSRLKPYIGLKN